MIMRNLAYHLWEAGYDVWLPNVRGHGNGQERSFISPYRNNDYMFDNILTEDLPFIFDKIYKITQRKIILIGFSMGGMLWENFLNGVKKNGSKMHKDQALAQTRNSKVSSYVAIVSPQDFARFNPKVKALLTPYSFLFKHGHIFLSLSNNRTPGHEGFFLEDLLEKIILKRVINFLLPLIFPRGIIDHRYSGEESYYLLKEYVSSPHTDYIYDIIYWANHGYYSRDGSLNYSTQKYISVPSLIFVSSHDTLANPHNVIRIASREYPKSTNLKFIFLQNRAHLDLMFDKTVYLIGEKIINFLKKGKNFMPDKDIDYIE